MKLNFLGSTFYAMNKSQINLNIKNIFSRQEAILFDRADLYEPNWSKAWKNIEYATKMFGSNNISFHFPTNDCDYFSDMFVKGKLQHALTLSSDLGLRLVVVHSNKRMPLNDWKFVNIPTLRKNFLEELYNMIENTPKNIILALENMPPIGNLNDDADPLFLFVNDFESLNHPRIKITFDINHYFNVVATMKKAKNNVKFKKVLPIYQECDYFDFEGIENKIVHWHFSGFNRIANPITNQICLENYLPWESEDVDENIFRQAASLIIKNNTQNNKKSVIFEVGEKDYCNRKNIFKISNWFSEVI